MICFLVADSCDVTIPVAEQTAGDTTGLNFETSPSCAATTCTVPSGSSITMAAGYCHPEGFSFYRNGQCMHAGNSYTSPDLILQGGYDVVYTCTNGNLQGTFPLVDLFAISRPFGIDHVTGISCGDTC